MDDEPLAQEILEGYIKRSETLQLLKRCNNALEAFDALHTGKVDLMFLDVKMPAMNGIDFMKSLKHPPAVIFTTAYSEYAAASYDLEAIDYLLKPITYERFIKSMYKLHKVQPSIIPQQKDYTYFKVGGKLIKVQHADILYAQSIKDYILVHTKTANMIVHMTMKYLCELLPPSFIRVHRSYLLNSTKISGINKNEVNIDLAVIPVGEHYRSSLIHLMDKL